ncbi:SnoaL-like protein [Pseudonocardia sediminis]|uniref:SnoaL-like protein n=2 Tax=Pseudonocardia sediminis TaxID=1397368 RepID=A0A4Q7V0S1_PSEST|nr:SnoaL-like protein [Pseudonocardia sediminis]
MPGMTDTTGAAAFRAAIESGDLDAAVALFRDDVEFLSPVVHRPYRGREELHQILTAAFATFEDFRYTHEYGGPDGHVLEFEARVGDRGVQGVDILRDGEGGLSRLTVMVRPYSAATLLRERMAALLSG